MGGDLPAYDWPPHRVYANIYFTGGFFSCGLACGSLFHFVRGLRSSPRGGRLAGAFHAVRIHAPLVAGKFAAYCAVFSAIEEGVALARRKEGGWSTITAHATFWGLHGMRRGGAPAAVRSALLGVAGIVALAEIDRALMVSYSENEMMNHAHPVPIGRDRSDHPALRGNPMDKDYE